MAIDRTGRINDLNILARLGLPYLIETWQRTAGIDLSIWTTTAEGTTGTILRDISEEPYQKVVLAGLANADEARLYTTQEWQLAPDTWGLNTFNKALIMEWECKFAVVDDIDNALFFMGLSAGVAANRAAMNLAGFILTGNALNAITDDGIGEFVSLVGGPVLTNWMKLSIVAYSAVIEFYVNEVLQARHTTIDTERLPDMNVHGMFYLPQEAGANTGELHVATVSIRPGVLL